MNIDATSLMPSLFSPKALEASTKPETSFASWVENQIHQTNADLNHADLVLTELASGKTQSLHQSMIALEEAKLSLQYLEQIRNRLMGAYQELLREQI